MSFNIGHALVGAVESFCMTGNPVAAAVGGAADGFATGGPAGQTASSPFESAAAQEAQPDALFNVNRLSSAREDFSYIGGDTKS